MRLSGLVMLMFLIARNAHSDRAVLDLQQPSNDPCLLKAFSQMLRDVGGRMKGVEIGAFIIADPNGGLALARWPSTAGMWTDRFEGAFPSDAVAVAHTHPVEWDRPSSGDVREAMRIGLPIYVVSQWHVWVVDPASGKQVEIARNGWRKRSVCNTDLPEERR